MQHAWLFLFIPLPHATMLETNQSQFFEAVLLQSLGIPTTVDRIQFISGGCINNAVKLETSKGAFFLKWNESQPAYMFEAEAKGLKLMEDTNTLTIPHVVGFGTTAEKSYLLMEFINSRKMGKAYWETFGSQLAAMHHHTHTHFGLDFDNFMGSLNQQNTYHENWIEFFVEKRLRPQFGMAFYNNLIPKSYLRQLDSLAGKLENILDTEKPSLVHGDLWKGNLITDSKGEPCLVDPAVYYGHREIDLAMTQLFGGFDPRFYDAYQEASPLAPNLQDRLEIYNLYPLMVHVNLFGTSYLSGIDRTLKKFI